MTERGSQYALEPRACPFVALADDRDRRLELPDARHRCFAEPDPQPRADAHQRAYCLSPAFAACPIFLDWAARAAADPIAAKRDAPTPALLARPSDLGPPPRPADPASRAWAAPPPWTGGDPQPRPAPPGEQLAVFSDPGDERDPDHDLIGSPQGVGASASPPEEDAEDLPGATILEGSAQVMDSRPLGTASLAPAADGPPDAGGPGSAAEPPGFLAGREREAWPSGAGRHASAGGSPAGPPIVPVPPRGPQATPSSRQPVGTLFAQQAQPAPVQRLDDRPDRIRSARREAHPKMRTLWMQNLPTVLAAVAGIAIIGLSALLLSAIIGQGGPTVPTRPPGSPTASPSPSPSPTPTPVTYIVRGGDTMEVIARRFGLTVAQIVCANGIADPNFLQVDQVLVIPDDDFQCASDGPPAASPGET